MKPIFDNFSEISTSYAKYRPEAPSALISFLLQQTNSTGVAWDCGTGNGQVALQLADSFTKVYATDISEAQLKSAPAHPNITYLNERAEKTSIPAGTVDLITAAQALHWFDFEHYFDEVERVAKPNCVICAWTYSLLEVDNEAVNKVIARLHNEITGEYWDVVSRYVNERYETIPFPYRGITVPEFSIEKELTAEEVIGYLRTWSSVKHYIEQEGHEPVALIEDDFHRAWGDTQTLRVTWPLHVRAGRVVL